MRVQVRRGVVSLRAARESRRGREVSGGRCRNVRVSMLCTQVHIQQQEHDRHYNPSTKTATIGKKRRTVMHAFFLCGLSESSHAQTAWPNGNLATVTLVACDMRVRRLRMSAAREVLSYLAVALSSHDLHLRLSAARQKPCKPHQPHTSSSPTSIHTPLSGQITLEHLTRIVYFES